MTTASRGTSKLTPEVHKSIIAAIRDGMPIATACEQHRVSRQAVYLWKARGERGEEPYATFLVDVTEARAHSLGRRITSIEAFGEGRECPTCKCEPTCRFGGDPKPLMWTAERLHPELQLTQKHEVQVQESIEATLTAVRGMMSEGAYVELVTALARIAGVDTEASGGVEPRQIGSGQ